MIVKTSRGTWVALTEEWSASGELLALHPRREPIEPDAPDTDGAPTGKPAPILQKRERQQLLLVVLADASQHKIQS